MTGSGVPFPYRVPSRSYIRIKKHAIVGAEAVILPEVTVGEGAVIGANSLVKKDCEPWTIYVGSPARAVKSRPKERILALEAQLRREMYDLNGNYIPKDRRKPKETT